MPNWCYTNITIHHDDKDKLKLLDALIDEWTSKDYLPNGFGKTWLGNIVGNSGVGTIDEDYKTDVRCRGSMTYKDLYDTELKIDTETAWGPMLEMWLRIIDKYLPDAELFYTAEECGCGIYYTNDPTIAGKYAIDSWHDDIECDFEADEQTARKILQNLLKTKETDIKTLIKMFEKSIYIEHMSINQWKYVDANELD